MRNEFLGRKSPYWAIAALVGSMSQAGATEIGQMVDPFSLFADQGPALSARPLYEGEYIKNASKGILGCASFDGSDPRAAEQSFKLESSQVQKTFGISEQLAYDADYNQRIDQLLQEDAQFSRLFTEPKGDWPEHPEDSGKRIARYRRFSIKPSCLKGFPVEFRNQGIFPVVSVLDTNVGYPLDLYGSNGKGYLGDTSERIFYSGSVGLGLSPSSRVISLDREAARLGKGFSLSQYLPSEGHSRFMLSEAESRSVDKKVIGFIKPLLEEKTYPSVQSSEFKVFTRVSFSKFLSGGDQLKLKLQMAGKTSANLPEHILYAAEPGMITWEGNFSLEKCEEDEGVRQGAYLSNKRISSVADFLERENELRLPGYRNCTYLAPVMTTADVAEWSEQAKFIIPTLRNVRIRINETYSDVSFESLNGLTTQILQLKSYQESGVPKNLAESRQADQAVIEEAQAVIEILKGSMPFIAQDQGDAALPNVAAYLHKNRAEIKARLASLSQKMKDPSVSFIQVLNVSLNLRRVYTLLDQALGLISTRKNTLGSLLEIPASAAPLAATPVIR